LHGTPHLGSGASFVSVTQQFNTTTSMGRLTLNILLSFSQFEREVIGERIRDKIAASKKKLVKRVRLGDVRFVYHQSTRTRPGPTNGLPAGCFGDTFAPFQTPPAVILERGDRTLTGRSLGAARPAVHAPNPPLTER
jgi:hypothetical protein